MAEQYTCSKCNGKGSVMCNLCGGTGQRIDPRKAFTCTVCNGHGSHPCPSCSGAGKSWIKH